MSNYRKYPAYKDSGVEWIGEIPGHWDVKQARHVFRIFSGSTPKSGEELFWDGDITWFTPEDLGNNQQKNISASRRKITEDGYKSCGTSLAKANSVVLSTRAPIGHIALSTVQACCNQGCRILEPENSCSGYWYYTLLSAKPALQCLGQGSTFMELPRPSLASFKLPYPPLEEQQAIASFLDRKTAQIDELITKKEELLKKLDEKRTALITRAVTKGLDPSAPMKESGVEWIGEIPKHWKVKQTRNIFKIYSGSTPRSGEELFWDGDIVWFTPEDLGNNQQKNISESRRKITEEGYKSCGTSLAKSNSVVLSTRAPIGHFALSTVPACCNQGCRILEPENGIPEYWYYTLLSAKPILQCLGQGSTFMELPRQSLAGFKLPVPPLDEQQAIAEHIEKKTARIDRQKAQVVEAIERLKEYRSALITDAVTGKINRTMS